MHLLKKTICLLILGLTGLSAFAQLEAVNWYFGEQAGLDFSTGIPLPLANGVMNQREGCSTISDTSGNLLFYTDGITVYNANHTVMPNGTDLHGHYSSTQSALIVPHPGSQDLYIIFTTDAQGGNFGGPTIADGALSYTMVDMTLDGGLGDVVASEKNELLVKPVVEKLTAVSHENGTDVWVIAHIAGTNEFIVYLVSATGVNPNGIISAVGEVNSMAGIPPFVGPGSGAIGHLKASPDGTKLASAILFVNHGLELFDFDTATGIISNPKKINNYGTMYGVEFSSNSKVLYASLDHGISGQEKRMLQYDLSLDDESAIKNSQTDITTGYINIHYSLQLGLDGKIYAAHSLSSTISVINNPNELGLGCDFQYNTVNVSGKSRVGLPNFITSYFDLRVGTEEVVCEGQEVPFEVVNYIGITSVEWDFGDPASGANNTSTNHNPTHIFSAPGTYVVTAVVETSLGNEITTTEEVVVRPLPIANTPDDLSTCEQAPHTEFDLTVNKLQVIGTMTPEEVKVTWHENLQDAQDGTNPIPNPEAYIIFASQTVYVRIAYDHEALGFPGLADCYDVTTQELIVNPVPEPGQVDDIGFCFDDTVPAVDLTTSASQAIGAHDPNEVIVTWYEWEQDAHDATNPIPNPGAYVPDNNGTIYVRIEFDYNTLGIPAPDEVCYNLTTLELFIAEQPEVSLGEDHIICRGGTTTLQAQLFSLNQDVTYIWYHDGGMLNTANQSSLDVSEAGIYRVEVYNDNCFDQAEVSVKLYETNPDCVLSQGLSPGVSLGQNDALNLEFLSESHGIQELQVYNRYGTLVYKQANYTNQWRGTDNDGDRLPTGLYYYVIYLSTEHPGYGNVVSRYLYLNR